MKNNEQDYSAFRDEQEFSALKAEQDRLEAELTRIKIELKKSEEKVGRTQRRQPYQQLFQLLVAAFKLSALLVE